MNPSKQQLIAYFSGVLPPHQKKWMEDWLSDNPDGDFVEECIHIAMETRANDLSNEPSDKTSQAYARFRELAEEHRLKTEDQNVAIVRELSERPNRRTVFLRWGMAAAAVLLFFAIGIEWYRHQLSTGRQPALAVLPKQQRFEAARATVTRIALADGSIVRLFPGSTLTLSDSFNQTNRIVSLKGRGFFEVAHDTARPFYVRCGSITTRVLGTAFDVNDGGAADTRVVVTKGRVQVAEANTVLSELTMGQGIAINNASGRWAVQAIDPEEYSAWTKGELGFRQAPLRDILPVLELWYKVSFQVHNSRLLDKKLTFFIYRQSLPEAMEVLSVTGGFRYNQHSDTIIIH